MEIPYSIEWTVSLGFYVCQTVALINNPAHKTVSSSAAFLGFMKQSY